MSSGELFLTFLVAILVFGPTKLPMLAEHLGKLARLLNQLKQQTINFWEAQLHEYQLKENSRKAEQVDTLYQELDQKKE
ncbi:twin-arginine translocase TatA/TatE family subunit [Legionella sp.]|uniref:Sec-independent protein translocase subunit TatA/TatB n=1 Tax=Legionella sp. TaxID=459 RepID=UPI0032206812